MAFFLYGLYILLGYNCTIKRIHLLSRSSVFAYLHSACWVDNLVCVIFVMIFLIFPRKANNKKTDFDFSCNRYSLVSAEIRKYYLFVVCCICVESGGHLF